MKASPNSVIPLINEKHVPAGNPSGVTGEAGLEAILCHTVVSSKNSVLFPSGYSHIPNVCFAVLVA